MRGRSGARKPVLRGKRQQIKLEKACSEKI
jgi:hypothetical protein